MIYWEEMPLRSKEGQTEWTLISDLILIDIVIACDSRNLAKGIC